MTRNERRSVSGCSPHCLGLPLTKPRLCICPRTRSAAVNTTRRKKTGAAKSPIKKPTVKLPHIPRPEDIVAGEIRVGSQIVLEREIAVLTIQLWWRKRQARRCVHRS